MQEAEAHQPLLLGAQKVDDLRRRRLAPVQPVHVAGEQLVEKVLHLQPPLRRDGLEPVPQAHRHAGGEKGGLFRSVGHAGQPMSSGRGGTPS
ncbi:MAG: hypothetical protein C0457_20495 [Polymorphum sp.]|nr:hypothetical protein [Polymorphum sp.]